MSKFKYIKIEKNIGSTIAMGDYNHLQDLNQNPKNISSDKEVWGKVLHEIKNLQTEIRKLPDEEEQVRDRELVPLVSECKSEAQNIHKQPKKEKKQFLDTLGKITDIASKSAPVLTKVKPFYDRIIELLTISG
ncbi:hypothetical protein [Peribacillus butanolivorans]|uniref:hypothetical protein n=1 Tax=Peribacillus butanolivorans TaxID=421767 RepID=UPI0036725048